MENQNILITELTALINGGSAHVSFKEAVDGVPFESLGIRPHGLPYSIWKLSEHIRIAQQDMLLFSQDGKHQSPKWPDEYWPKDVAPETEAQWHHCLSEIEADKNKFLELIKTLPLFTPIPHGTGQNVLREALQIADHNAYHTAEIIVIRRLTGNWKS